MTGAETDLTPSAIVAGLQRIAELRGSEATAAAVEAGLPVGPVDDAAAAVGDSLARQLEAELASIADWQRSAVIEAPTFPQAAISEDLEERRGTFTIESLDKGFGYTFGNSLRRVLLSSLDGVAVTAVRFGGGGDEEAALPGVEQDRATILRSLQGLVIRMRAGVEEVEASLLATGPAEVTAGDIELPPGIEILNPDTAIATLEADAKLELELTISRGQGFAPAEGVQLGIKGDDDAIPIDAAFSPVRQVSYAVGSAGTGQRPHGDKLTLELETDGTIDPAAALREASEILIKNLQTFNRDLGVEVRVAEVDASGDRVQRPAEASAIGSAAMSEVPIEDLDLGVRSYNSLKRAGVRTIADLANKSLAELSELPSFGSKSIEEILEALQEDSPAGRSTEAES